jgi:hypothetical protein
MAYDAVLDGKTGVMSALVGLLRPGAHPRPQAWAAQVGRRHHVRHRALPSHLRQQARAADLSEPSVVELLGGARLAKVAARRLVCTFIVLFPSPPQGEGTDRARRTSDAKTESLDCVVGRQGCGLGAARRCAAPIEEPLYWEIEAGFQGVSFASVGADNERLKLIPPCRGEWHVAAAIGSRAHGRYNTEPYWATG